MALGRMLLVLVAALPRVARADCTDPAIAEAKSTAAAVANEQRFGDALKKLKLDRVRLAPSSAKEDRASAGKVVVHDQTSVIVLEQPEMSCGGPQAAEFASAGNVVFHLVREAALGKTMRFEICSCTGSPAGCGAVPHAVATGYVIPNGMQYGGVKRVAYVGDVVITRYGVGQAGGCPQAPRAKAPARGSEP